MFPFGGAEALENQSPRPSRVWNRIPDDVCQRIVDLALDVPELSPRELAVHFTDIEKYFVSEASVYRLLKSLDLITSPAFIVIKAADEFRDKTTAIKAIPPPLNTHTLADLTKYIGEFKNGDYNGQGTLNFNW